MPEFITSKGSAPINFQVFMNDADLDYLRINTMQWANADWRDQVESGRFLVEGSTPDLEAWPSLRWKVCYWFSDYPAVILARSYLDARGAQFQVASDEADDGGWVILTDYETANAAKLTD